MKILKKLLILLLILLLLLGTFIFLIGFGYYSKTLNEKSLTSRVEEVTSKEHFVPFEQLPKNYINAVIAVEDHRYYEHGPVDFIGIARALYTNIRDGEFDEGGSTITQQLSKNIYFTQEKKITRKIAEVFMSFEIEKNYNKDEILELYLNTSYFGEGCYTVKEASRKYFGKEPKKMTDYEAIMLAGIPNAPSVYSLTKNPELAKQRQKQVINKMIEYKYLTQSEADKILKQ